MAYRIPSDEEVVTAIQRVVSRHHTIISQHLMKELVEEELKKLDKGFRISGTRIRKLVLKSKYFHLEIDYKAPPEDDQNKKKVAKKGVKGKPRMEKLKACPVCGSKVKPIKNRTLRGGLITTGFRCRECPYHTGFPIKRPARYTFSIRRL